jgi:hypothetical protein
MNARQYSTGRIDYAERNARQAQRWTLPATAQPQQDKTARLAGLLGIQPQPASNRTVELRHVLGLQG